jgi:PRTRC genetic system protein B
MMRSWKSGDWKMSFSVRDQEASYLKMDCAIMLYSSDQGYAKQRYATIHPVEIDENGAPVIRAGRPADLDSLKASVSELLSSSRVRSGVLPDNILSVGLDHIVWWQRPGRRSFFFDCRGKVEDGAANVGQRAGEGLTPGLVFVAKGQDMMVFAVKGESRPEATTPLCHAPLMNVWSNGTVCTGSMPLPASTVAESVAAWESAFWNSNFSHPNHPKPVNYKGGIHQFSIDLLDGKFKKFPQRVLVPIKGLSLEKLILQLDDPHE